MTCQIQGCAAPGYYRVVKDGVVRRVCRRCMEELVALFGWLVGETDE